KHSNHYLIEAAPKYRLLKQIGQGGMGTVYQARDTKLNRLVALKFLRDQEQDLVARFLQEARSQARIDHKNICKVYEVGEMEGMPYICMQYINGRSLEQVYKQMNLEEKIKVMKDVSEALHHAHKLGIIHRDIKPANIMVEKREDGNWFPIVMDFGVAREVENRGLTHTGTVVGTPAYMSPEQAQGDNKNIDRRADIYSIGTTLYELIAGHTPFKNDMLVKLIMDIVQKEPESLLQILPNIPTDINLIVMKCLEKEPNNRYQSALALANDLQAYLNGETISVREVSFIKRTLKKAKKHKAIVSLSASAAAILILVVTLFIYIQIRTYQQAQITEEFIGEAEKLEDIMRFSHLMPLHNISQEVAVVNSKLKNIDEKMYRKGSISQGAGNYALGRGYLALQEYSKANDYFDRSRSAGFSSPDLDYAQGKTLGILYELEKEQLEKTIKPQERKEKEQQLNQQFRQPALNYLNSYKSQKNIDTKTTLYIEALIDYYDNNFEQVFKKAHEALIQFPWLYEAHTLVGRAYYKQADAEYKRGEYKSAEELYQKAEQSYLAAISLGQSDPEVYNLIAETFTQRLFLASEEHRRDDSQQFFQNALSFYEKASEIKPDFLEAYLTKSRLLQNYAQNLTYTGTDPTIYLKQSIDAGQKALEISLERKATHRLSSIYNSLSRSYSILSEFEKQDGRPSIETVEKMIENAQKAVDLSPASSMFYANLSASYFLKVEYQDNFGLDITESLNKAIYYSEKAIEMDKDPIFALSNLGFFYFCRAEKELQSGESPIASFKKAEELLNSSISKRPKDYWIYGWLAEVETLKAA
ncbi:MAG: protein kinase, partial [Blastocatellia bacterium]|nr:protein kinase [Blastocatellia bacterium]